MSTARGKDDPPPDKSARRRDERAFDPKAVRLALLAAVVGLAVFLYGYSGGSGPAFLTSGVLKFIGIALMGYSVTKLLLLSMLKRRMELSPGEVELWGPKLEKATPRILDGISAKKPMKEVAAEVEEQEGIPAEITLKYVIALGKYRDQLQAPESGAPK